MARLCKCHGSCGEKYPKEELFTFETNINQRYCKDCFEQIKKDREDREELYTVIKELYNVSYPSGMMLKQIKEYKEVNGYSYKAMANTLRYCATISGIKFSPLMGVGIIPHQYERAKAAYLERQRKEEEFAKGINTEVVTIKIPKLNNTNHWKNQKMINMEDLLND